jgi:hypothetical protein
MMKSTRTSLIALVMTLVSVTLPCDTTSAREVRCKLLQQKLGRLYFSAGKEENIFPGCRWVIYRDSTDTLNPLLRGKIAESYEGMSVSDSGGMSSVAGGQGELTAIISPATKDHRPIHVRVILGTMFDWIRTDSGTVEEKLPNERDIQAGNIPTETPRVILVTRPVTDDPSSWVVDTIHIRNQYVRFLQGLQIGEGVDVIYGFSPHVGSGQGYVLPNPSPYIVTMFPKVSAARNMFGLITTALRYRLDTSRLDLLYPDSAMLQLNFLSAQNRLEVFPYDPAKGKGFLKTALRQGKNVELAFWSGALFPTNSYLCGVLNNAGFQAWSLANPQMVGGDLSLGFVPVDIDRPENTLRFALTYLALDTLAKASVNEPIRLAARLLTEIASCSDSIQKDRLLARVERILMEDIGAFPLFRPVLYVCAKEDIRGLCFDKNGRLDLSNIYRVKLPTDTTSGSP